MSPAAQVAAPADGAQREPRAARLARRAISIPLYVVAFAATLASAPLWIPVLWLVDRLQPGRSALACGIFLLWYLGCELVGLAAALAIWLLAPPWLPGARERFERWNFRLQCAWACWLLRGAQRLFGFTIEVEGASALRGGPMLLLLRHASLADTLLAAVLVSRPHGIRLRYVLKRELLWDPCLDVVGNRLRNHFVRRGSDDPERERRAVAALLDGLRPDEGVLIYPEGTRFSEAKRRQRIERLRARGDEAAARQAQALRHVLLPRAGGTLALLAANPGLDVVIGVHHGFEHSASARALWRGALRGARVRVAFWRIPFEALPNGEAARREWLAAQWQRVDAWLARHAQPREPDREPPQPGERR